MVGMTPFNNKKYQYVAITQKQTIGIQESIESAKCVKWKSESIFHQFTECDTSAKHRKKPAAVDLIQIVIIDLVRFLEINGIQNIFRTN